MTVDIQLGSRSHVEGWHSGIGEKDEVTLVRGSQRMVVCWGSVIAHTHGAVLKQLPSGTKLNKVGPKGYIHGWIYVGPQAPGSRVFHPEHGHGTVNQHNLDPGKKVRGSVDVHFDSGEKHSFRARFKDSSQPRLYGPAKTDEELRAEVKPKVPPMQPMEHPGDETKLTSGHMRMNRIGFVIDPKGKTIGEVQHTGSMSDRTYRFVHASTNEIKDGFGSEQDALDALVRHHTLNDSRLQRPRVKRPPPPFQHNLQLIPREGMNNSWEAHNSEGRVVGTVHETWDEPGRDAGFGYYHMLTGDSDSGHQTPELALEALAKRDAKHTDDQFAKNMALRLEREAQAEIKRRKEEEREQLVFAPRRAVAHKLPASSKVSAEKRASIEARRKRIIELHGENLKLHDPTSKATKQHLKDFFGVPEHHHEIIAKRGYRIDLGEGPVGRYHPDLANVRPGGYSEGSTWMDSAGAHHVGNGDSDQPWLVFGNTVGHGSHNMVAHEMGHAMDYSLKSEVKIGDSRNSSGDRSSPWGPGFMSYFDGLNAYDREQAAKDIADMPVGSLPSYVRLNPYYRSADNGGHAGGHKEMFAEAYSAYIGSAKADRAQNISRTLKGVDDGDHHIGQMLTEYFDDLTTWIEANK